VTQVFQFSCLHRFHIALSSLSSWLCSQRCSWLLLSDSLQLLKALAAGTLARRTSIAVRSGDGAALPISIVTRSPPGPQHATAAQLRRQAFWPQLLQRRPCQTPQRSQRQSHLRQLRWSLAHTQKRSHMQAGPSSRTARTPHRWFLVVPMRASTL